MTTWDTLLTSALLGLERRPLPAYETNTEGDSAEHAFLLSAAALGLQRRAGYEPPIHEARLPAGPAPETQPTVSRRAQAQLTIMLAQPQRYGLLLLEWLSGHVRKGRRVPHPYLPALLDITTKGSELSAWVAASYGERGRWLALQNEKWRHPLAFEESTLRNLRSQPPRQPDPKALQKALTSDKITDTNSVVTAVSAYGPVSTPLMVGLVFDRLFQFTGRHIGVWRMQPFQDIAAHFTREMLPQAIGRLHQEQMNGVQELDPVIDWYQFRREILEEIDRD
jgi:hypothetical protein